MVKETHREAWMLCSSWVRSPAKKKMLAASLANAAVSACGIPVTDVVDRVITWCRRRYSVTSAGWPRVTLRFRSGSCVRCGRAAAGVTWSPGQAGALAGRDRGARVIAGMVVLQRGTEGWLVVGNRSRSGQVA